MRRGLRIVIAAVTILGLLVVGVGMVLDAPRPRGTKGAEAEALARRMERAVRIDAWEATGAIAFEFGGRHRYLWDRHREFVEVSWDSMRVQLPLQGGRAVVLRDGRPVTRYDERLEARERAFRYFVNDAFWLNPIAKLREPGVELSAATFRGRRGLLVTYTTGGITPGDAYFWTVRPDGTPDRWAMWVSVLPIGGIETSWERYVTLPTGARIATRHANGPLRIDMISDVRAARTLAELAPGPDPFARLVAVHAPRTP